MYPLNKINYHPKFFIRMGSKKECVCVCNLSACYHIPLLGVKISMYYIFLSNQTLQQKHCYYDSNIKIEITIK
jgi:hypothetical protein